MDQEWFLGERRIGLFEIQSSLIWTQHIVYGRWDNSSTIVILVLEIPSVQVCL